MQRLQENETHELKITAAQCLHNGFWQKHGFVEELIWLITMATGTRAEPADVA